MLFKYKITEVKFCMSFHNYHGVTLAAHDAASYIPCLRPHRKLISIAILLIISEKCTFRKKENNQFDQGPFLCDAAQITIIRLSTSTSSKDKEQ